MITRRTLLAASAATLALPHVARAQAYPSRFIRWIVPFAAGGGSDVIARLLSDELTKVLGQPLVIENKPGQAASIGADIVAKSAADGYTILIATPGVQMTNPFLYASLPYNAEKDFTPIIHLAHLPNLMVVHPSVPANTVAEFIAHAKANSGKLNFASTGPGSTSHLAGELFKTMAGVDMVHVPYRGSGPAVIDLVAGRVQVAIDSYTAMIPHVKNGALRALGISTPQRVPDYPDIPAIAETLPGFDASAMLYITAPAGVPREAVARLNAAFNEVLKIERIRARFKELGMTPSGGTPEDLSQVIVDGRARWKAVIQSANIKVE
jgi:tripartite-type tricarboxylate transporter receptor subunit TctC